MNTKENQGKPRKTNGTAKKTKENHRKTKENQWKQRKTNENTTKQTLVFFALFVGPKIMKYVKNIGKRVFLTQWRAGKIFFKGSRTVTCLLVALLKLPAITSNYKRVPPTTNKLPASTNNYQRLPATSCHYELLPATTNNYHQQLAATTCNYLNTMCHISVPPSLRARTRTAAHE